MPLLKWPNCNTIWEQTVKLKCQMLRKVPCSFVRSPWSMIQFLANRIYPFILNMYAVIIACNRVFICIFKPALTNKVVNACPKHYSLYNIISYILLVCIILASFWNTLSNQAWNGDQSTAILESKGVAINSFSSFILKESSHYYT